MPSKLIKWVPPGPATPHPELYAVMSRSERYVAAMRETIEAFAERDRQAFRYSVWRQVERPAVTAFNVLDRSDAYPFDVTIHNAAFVRQAAEYLRSTSRKSTGLSIEEELTTLDVAVRAVRSDGNHVVPPRGDGGDPVDRPLADVLTSWRNVFVVLSPMPSPFGMFRLTGCYVDRAFPDRPPDTCKLTLTCQHDGTGDLSTQDAMKLLAMLSRTVSVDYDLRAVGADGILPGPNSEFAGVREAVAAVVSTLARNALVGTGSATPERAVPPAAPVAATTPRLSRGIHGRRDVTVTTDVASGTGWMTRLSGHAEALLGPAVREAWSPRPPWDGHLSGVRNVGDDVVVVWDGPRAASAHSGAALGIIRARGDDPVRFAHLDGDGLAVLSPTVHDVTPWGPEDNGDPFTSSALDDPRRYVVDVPGSGSGDAGIADAATGRIVAAKEAWMDALCLARDDAEPGGSGQVRTGVVQARALAAVDGWRPEWDWIVRAKVEAARVVRGEGRRAVADGRRPLPWQGPWSTPEPSGKAEPAVYGDVEFPSVEWAVCAAFLDACGWAWEYPDGADALTVLGRSPFLARPGPFGVVGHQPRASDAGMDVLVLNGVQPDGVTSLGACYKAGRRGSLRASVLVHSPGNGADDLGHVGVSFDGPDGADRITGRTGQSSHLYQSVIHAVMAEARSRVAGLIGDGAYETVRGPKSDLLSSFAERMRTARTTVRMAPDGT